jgi:anaerobic selenocysteine-containing dehydrogenase
VPKLEICAEDARSRDLESGDRVRVFNHRGAMVVAVEVSERVESGYVSIPQGFWLSLLDGGSSVNVLTTDLLADMGGGSALQETRVQVEKV